VRTAIEWRKKGRIPRGRWVRASFNDTGELAVIVACPQCDGVRTYSPACVALEFIIYTCEHDGGCGFSERMKLDGLKERVTQ
jgi:hypothetical protein